MPPAKKTTTDPADPKDDLAKPAAAPDPEPAAEQGPSDYRKDAAKLAADTRQLVEDVRERMNELTERYSKLHDLEPAAADSGAMSQVRRIPMALEELKTALTGVDQAGAGLVTETGY